MSRPDLTGLQPVYRVQLGRGLRWLFLAVFLLNVPAIVFRLTDDPDGFDIALSGVQLLCFGFLCGYHVLRPDSVLVLEDGLVWQKAFRRRVLVTWDAVREVQVQTRWQDASSVVLEDGRKLPLSAMPREDAKRLAAALTACR